MERKPEKSKLQSAVDKDRWDELKNKWTEQRASQDAVTQAGRRGFKSQPAVSQVGAAVRLQSYRQQLVSEAGPLQASRQSSSSQQWQQTAATGQSAET